MILSQEIKFEDVFLFYYADTEQFAAEFKDMGHGVFTYAIIEGLSGKADGAGRDGKITIKELADLLKTACLN